MGVYLAATLKDEGAFVIIPCLAIKYMISSPGFMVFHSHPIVLGAGVIEPKAAFVTALAG